MAISASNWRVWPVIAAAIALLFITWDITLMSRTRAIQGRIGQQVGLLDDLGQLNSALNQLSIMHRVDANTGQYNWHKELANTHAQLEHTAAKHEGNKEIAQLHSALIPLLHNCDSLHREVLMRNSSFSEERMPEAVFQLMLQRAQKQVDRVSRNVHEKGLGGEIANLSERWSEVQLILFLACMLAMVFALLAGMARRLLVETRKRSEQLAVAKIELEQSNRELRETMLSKEEKEVMIKEIHHRVKNNLQIVRSLIRFQSEQVSDPKVQELFRECINRVGAMALVHEQTYLSKDLANIDVSSYLDSLVRDLVYAYSVNRQLTMDIDIQVKTLGVDTLVPLGLMINEIISNSFKYAFPESGTGTIIVHLKGSELEGLHMRIGDDGVGLKSREGFHRPNSLGMDLIHTLANQLDSDITLMDVQGTQYELISHKLLRRKVA